MKSIFVSITAVLSIVVVSLIPLFDAAADDQTCFIMADSGEVRVFVWDKDDEGETTDKAFEGWIKDGQKVQIKSQTGRITYSYKEKSDDRSYGSNHADCKNGNIIPVP